MNVQKKTKLKKKKLKALDGFIFRQENCLIKKSDKEDYRKYFNKGTTDMHQSTELRTCSTDTL